MPDSEVEGLKALVVYLLNRVSEATLTAETLRELLQRRGVLSEAEVEELLAEGRRIQTASMVGVLEKAMGAYYDESFRRLLERLEGPKH